METLTERVVRKAVPERCPKRTLKSEWVISGNYSAVLVNPPFTLSLISLETTTAWQLVCQCRRVCCVVLPLQHFCCLKHSITGHPCSRFPFSDHFIRPLSVPCLSVPPRPCPCSLPALVCMVVCRLSAVPASAYTSQVALIIGSLLFRRTSNFRILFQLSLGHFSRDCFIEMSTSDSAVEEEGKSR